jgi:HD-GYP domain-containing protein (c-di-GMP phosphodiesterase class II)
LAVELGELLGASPQELTDTYYIALLHASGCTSNSHEATQVFGDDIAHRAAFYLIDAINPAEVLAFYRSNVGAGQPPEIRARLIEEALANAPERGREGFEMMCEVAQGFAGWLGLSEGVRAGLGYVFARWDGRGFPGAAGEEIPFAMRLHHVVRDASVFMTVGGVDEACEVIARRSGAAYEPRLADLAAAHLPEMVAAIDDTAVWTQAIAREPAPVIWIAPEEIDHAFATFAAITGLKSPWMREHSIAAADLAEAAAWRLGFQAPEVSAVRRAALAANLGQVGISNAIWEKPAALGFGEWERVRLHPHFTERAFAQSQTLAAIGRLAGSHHERLDGSGYQRGTNAPGLDRLTRVLAAADAYAAMREARPYRAALAPSQAEQEMTREAREGRLDPDAVNAVLAAAGHDAPTLPRELPAGLTQRELDVVRVLVQGGSNAEMADALGISAKTVGHHVEHIYQKAGVRTRAAATLWAFEQNLVHARTA